MGLTPYYQDDAVTIYCGDSRELVPRLFSSGVDVVMTDPPYPGYEKGWEVPDVADVLGSIAANVKVVFWPVLCPSPLAVHTAEHVWHKPNGNSSYHYERILVEGGPATCRVFRSAAILPNYTQYAAEAVDHPTQKPVKLMRQLLGIYTGALTLDPFMGSGTTLRAAKDLGRKAIGIEINERYCEMAAGRMAQEVLAVA